MSARILVVDDIEANVRLLEAKLTAEYYDVLTASDGPTALAIAAKEKPDIVLLDVMMPGMDGFQVCRRLKDDPETRHVPVVLVTALDGRADRIAGLESGADEFLTKPIDDVLLFARVRSLTRLKMVIDELRDREASGRRMGVIAGAASRLGGTGGRILIVDDHERQAQRVATELAIEHRPVIEADPEKALMTAKGPVDLIIVNATARAFDGLRFAAQLRSDEATRNLPILAVVDPDDRHRMVKALDIGLKAELYQLLLNEQAERGMAVLMITHDLMEAVRLADSILVVAAEPGRIVHRLELQQPARLRSDAEVYRLTAEFLQHPAVCASFDILPPQLGAAQVRSTQIESTQMQVTQQTPLTPPQERRT